MPTPSSAPIAVSPAPIRKAIIPVAGLGTRMLPATKAIPKELLPVYDRPIIQWVVEEAIAAGIEEIILVTRSGKEAIENHFDAHYELEHRLERKGKQTILKTVKNIIPTHINIVSIRQADALGLGHAVLCAKKQIGGEPFAVLLPDVLLLDALGSPHGHSFKAMMAAWQQTGHGQLMVEQVAQDQVEQYGIADVNGANITPFKATPIKQLVEKPNPQEAPSNLAVLGRYLLPNNVMQLLQQTKPGAGGEIQLTDALDALIAQQPLSAFLTNAQTHDCGNKRGYLGASVAVGMRDEATKAYLQRLVSHA